MVTQKPIIPSAAAITPHLLPATVTLTHRDGEVELSPASEPLTTNS